jgi:hypothetical protein
MIQHTIGQGSRLSFRLNTLASASNLSVANLGNSVYMCGSENTQQFFASRSDVVVFDEIDGKALVCPAAIIYKDEASNEQTRAFVDEFANNLSSFEKVS